MTRREIEQRQHGDRNTVVVQDSRTKQKFVVLPQDTFNRARVLFEYLTMQSETEPSATAQPDAWNDADNARRVALINKKYDAHLTSAEERELDALQERAYRYRARVAPVRSNVLRLLAEALEQRRLRGTESA